MRISKRYITILLLVIAAVLSFLLLLRFQDLNQGNPSHRDFCQMVMAHTCDAALNDNASWQLSFPVVSMGLIFFGLIGMLLILENPKTDQLALTGIAAGLGIGIYQTYYLITESIPCPFCYIIHGILLIGFLLTFGMVKTRGLMTRRLKVLSVGAIILGTAAEGLILESGIGSKIDTILNKAITNFESSPPVNFYQRAHSQPACTNEKSVKITVFSSYECPACQSLDENLDKLKEKYGEQVCIDYRNFPLSSQCNPSVSSDMQPYSCVAAKAAIAAGLQGKFDEYHYSIFNASTFMDSTLLLNIANAINLDVDRWKVEMDSDTVLSILNNDINEANQIGISATPTIFINGRKVNNNPAIIFYLIDKLTEGQ